MILQESINPKDLLIEIFSNPDYPQHMHAPSEVKITHKPTGLSASYHKGRSTHENRKMALALFMEKFEDEKKPQPLLKPS